MLERFVGPWHTSSQLSLELAIPEHLGWPDLPQRHFLEQDGGSILTRAGNLGRIPYESVRRSDRLSRLPVSSRI